MNTALLSNLLVTKRQGGGGQPPYVFSDEYIAFRNYLESQSIPLPSTAGQQADDQLIKDLKDAGLWDEVDAIWNFTTEGVANYALVNLKNPGTFTATLHGTVSTSYTAKDGFHGNAAQGAYIAFHWNPSEDGVNFLQNDASIHAYTTDDTQYTAPLLGCANASAVGRLFLTARDENDQLEVHINSISGATGGEGGAGLISGVRAASGSHQGYRNGVQQSTDTDTSSTVSAFDLVGFALRTDTGIHFLNNGHLGLVIVGSSSITPSTLNTIWNNHLSRIAGL